MRSIWPALCVFFLFQTALAWADQLKVEVAPQKPVVGENFQAYFRIFTDSSSEPRISFKPEEAIIVGKSNQGISTRTIYANGQLTVTREITIVYDLLAKNLGTAAMRDIKVEIGGKWLQHPDISFQVVKESQIQGEIFVQADVPKTTVYLGEGIIVRYYLYSKVPFNSLDVKRYPKLNSFLKRFLQEPDRSERVSVNGQLYLRSQIYAAKLFPEKAGELKIDPLSLSATYAASRPGDPFGGFGMGREMRTRTFESETVTLKVLPLPEPVPSHFTGLIGKHDFQLDFNQTRLIVNEPMEAKLTVSGSGALENLEAPAIVTHQGLERFETTGDLRLIDANQATKTFSYTFLARENLTLPARELTLSYFDPASGGYVPTVLNVPEIVVAGGSPGVPRPPAKDQAAARAAPSETPPASLTLPALNPERRVNILGYLNVGLALGAALLLLSWFVRLPAQLPFLGRGKIPAGFRRQFSTGELARWLAPLIIQTGKTPTALIRSSDLDEESKQYFLKLLENDEKKDYSGQSTAVDYKFEPRHFKQLAQFLESKSDDHPRKPA
jgi:hypothetical protein